MHIPVGTRVNLVATTDDVIHSFWVPSLNRKIDTIPGQQNRILLEADRPGRFRGQCSEFCGLQHAHMAVEVVAEPFLVRAGLMARTPRGRVATPAAWEHLGLPPPEAPGPAGFTAPGPLFE
jgi:cytochrome c oxidase subunit 2